MKRINFSQAVTIVANLGVFAGLVLLAIELEQNNDLMAAQARFNRLSVAAESATILAENPDLAGFIVKANGGAELDSTEKTRLDYYLQRVFTNMEGRRSQRNLTEGNSGPLTKRSFPVTS